MIFFQPPDGADLQWRSLPQAEAPTELAGETGYGQPRYPVWDSFHAETDGFVMGGRPTA